VASSILALVIGLLSNVAASTLRADQPWIVWGALILTFLISLPVSLYLFRYTGDTEDESSRRATSFPKVHLPAKPYLRFFGREAQLGEIVNSLREPGQKRIVGIDGMGGIGKTALAREAVQRCQEEKMFDFYLWEPRSYETGLNTGTAITWSSLLVTIGRQIGAPDIQRLDDREKEARLADSLRAQHGLIVLDNLETAIANQDEFVRRLWPLLENSKMLMTSRRRFKGDVYPVHLRGLEEESAIQMIRYEAAEKAIRRVVDAPVQDQRLIARTTGGSPLALKLMIGQLQHLPLETVIEALQNVELDENGTEEDDYVRFYKSIFWTSWQLLSEQAQRLLVSMAVFPPGGGGTVEALQSISDLEAKTLSRVLDELWRFSFVEAGEAGLRVKKTRYYLHPLTRNFVISDIVKPSQVS